MNYILVLAYLAVYVVIAVILGAIVVAIMDKRSPKRDKKLFSLEERFRWIAKRRDAFCYNTVLLLMLFWWMGRHNPESQNTTVVMGIVAFTLAGIAYSVYYSRRKVKWQGK